jgi:hypothetical protein
VVSVVSHFIFHVCLHMPRRFTISNWIFWNLYIVEDTSNRSWTGNLFYMFCWITVALTNLALNYYIIIIFRLPEMLICLLGTSKCWKINSFSIHYTCEARYCWLSFHNIDAKPWTPQWWPNFRSRYVFIWSNIGRFARPYRMRASGEGAVFSYLILLFIYSF